MKILVCSSEYPPEGSGIANVIFGIINATNKKNIEFVVCSPSGPDILLGNTQLIQKTGILGLLYFWFRVGLLLKKDKWDIIWLHNPLPVFTISSKSAICTYHSTYFGVSKKMHDAKFFLRCYYYIGAVIEKYCLKKLPNARFVGVSSQVCNELKERCPNNTPLIILNGVDTKRFSTLCKDRSLIKEDLRIINNQVILYVGRLDPTKFVDSIIIGFPIILKKIPLVKLLIVGDGPQKEDLINLTKTLDISESVFFCGSQPNDVLPQYYCASDIVVCPYSGLVLFEAMASGKVIVAYDVEWHSEVITHMENGILVENLNQVEFANAVVSLLTDPTLAKKLGKKAREFTLKNLDWSIISDQYLSLFTEKRTK